MAPAAHPRMLSSHVCGCKSYLDVKATRFCKLAQWTKEVQQPRTVFALQCFWQCTCHMVLRPTWLGFRACEHHDPQTVFAYKRDSTQAHVCTHTCRTIHSGFVKLKFIIGSGHNSVRCSVEMIQMHPLFLLVLEVPCSSSKRSQAGFAMF